MTLVFPADKNETLASYNQRRKDAYRGLNEADRGILDTASQRYNAEHSAEFSVDKSRKNLEKEASIST